MRTLVLYYSFTGNTRKIASALASAIDAELCEITCLAYSRGFWGPWRQALDVLLRRSPVIEVPEQSAQVWDLVVIGGPVWAARPAPPIRSYLQRYAAHHRQMALFVSCGGTSPKFPPSAAIAEMAALAKKPPKCTHVFTQDQLAGGNFAAALGAFRDDLRAAP
ncbi:MAG: flavodoxin family protein [Devosia sp.]